MRVSLGSFDLQLYCDLGQLRLIDRSVSTRGFDLAIIQPLSVLELH